MLTQSKRAFLRTMLVSAGLLLTAPLKLVGPPRSVSAKVNVPFLRGDLLARFVDPEADLSRAHPVGGAFWSIDVRAELDSDGAWFVPDGVRQNLEEEVGEQRSSDAIARVIRHLEKTR